MSHHWEPGFECIAVRVRTESGGGEELSTDALFMVQNNATGFQRQMIGWWPVYGANREEKAAVLQLLVASKVHGENLSIYTPWPYRGPGVYGAALIDRFADPDLPDLPSDPLLASAADYEELVEHWKDRLPNFYASLGVAPRRDT